MNRGIAFYLDLMDIIADGSMTVQLHKTENIAKLTVSRNEIAVDIGMSGMAYDIFHPMLVVSKDGKEIKAQKRGKKWRSNTMLLKRFLKLFEGIEETFVEKEKVLRLRFKGTDVLVIGPEEGSLFARVAGLKNTSLPHKVHLLLLAKDFFLSRPEDRSAKPEPVKIRAKPVKKAVKKKRKGFLGRVFNR